MVESEVWIKIGESDPSPVVFQDGGNGYKLKKAAKLENEITFQHTDVRHIVLRDSNGNVLANSDGLASLILQGLGTSDNPFLVDDPAPEGNNVITALP